MNGWIGITDNEWLALPSRRYGIDELTSGSPAGVPEVDRPAEFLVRQWGTV
jgi:hypothetical protein